MLGILVILLMAIYGMFLVGAAYKAREINSNDVREAAFARSGMSTGLVLLSFSATLFSTFTLLGVPNFFRVHGVGTWLFIGVTDVAMGFVILWFGLHFHRRLKSGNHDSMVQILSERYRTRLVGWLYVIAVAIFLTPYVAIQIKGVSEFFSALSPVPVWFWSLIILVVIWFYSAVGGLRAIIYSDVAQGVTLFCVVTIVALLTLGDVGGLSGMFSEIRSSAPELLSAPGPNGFMTWQYVIASFIAILWMPITQPQLTTRIATVRSQKDIGIMAIGISLCAFAILLPTIVIGLGGAIIYGDATGNEFLATILVRDQVAIIGALAIVGLLAAAMSTADSQIYALSTEFNVAMESEGRKISPLKLKLVAATFAIICMLVSFVSVKGIIDLARVSFAGTAIIGPMIILAMSQAKRLSWLNPIIAIISLSVFLASVLGYLPARVGEVRLDLILFGVTALAAIFEWSYLTIRFGADRALVVEK